MVRIYKPVLALLAGLSLVVAGCGGGSTVSPGTTGSGATSTASGATASAAGPTATPANPETLFDQGIATGPAWKSFHLKVTLDGTIKASFLKSSTNATIKKLTSDITLDGTVLEGDLDATNLAAHLALTVPAIPGVVTDPITGDMIVKDSILYLKVSALGTKYTKVNLASLANEFDVPVAVPTAGGSSLTGIADKVATLRQTLEADGIVPTLAGIEQIGGKDAYRINLSVPIDKLNSDIAAAMAKSSADPALKFKIDSASVAIWIYKDTHQLAQVQVAGASSTVGNITFTMTLTNFDQPVTINAPAASEISK